MGVFTGLRDEELYYIHYRETGYSEHRWKCNSLHPTNEDSNTNISCSTLFLSYVHPFVFMPACIRQGLVYCHENFEAGFSTLPW
jgi:hypothetical protein